MLFYSLAPFLFIVYFVIIIFLYFFVVRIPVRCLSLPLLLCVTQTRKSLPIFSFREDLLQAVHDHQVGLYTV